MPLLIRRRIRKAELGKSRTPAVFQDCSRLPHIRFRRTTTDRMVNRVFEGRPQIASMDLDGIEHALREMGQRVGGGLLEKLPNASGDIPGQMLFAARGIARGSQACAQSNW